jgi:hypothetical protein
LRTRRLERRDAVSFTKVLQRLNNHLDFVF